MPASRNPVDAYLEQLPPSLCAKVVPYRVGNERERIQIAGKHLFRFVAIGSHLSRLLAKGLVADASLIAEANRVAARHAHSPTIILAPYVSPEMGAYFEEQGLSYLDRLGNCHLLPTRAEHALFHSRERKPPAAKAAHRGLRPPGLQVEFAILTQRRFLNNSVRLLAGEAEVGKSTVANTLNELTRRGLIGRSAAGRQVLDYDRLLDDWVASYATTLRPSLVIGLYRTPHADPGVLEAAIERATKPYPWGWGGGAAAYRLTQYYRGEQTTLHVSSLRPELLRPVLHRQWAATAPPF